MADPAPQPAAVGRASDRSQRALIGVAAALAVAGAILLAVSGSAPFANGPTGLPLAAHSFGAAEAEAPAAVTYAPTAYEHPSGAFVVTFPQDWQLDEDEREARFTGPDDAAEFVLWFDAPAGPLNLPDYLKNWVTARYGALADFSLGKRITQPDGSLLQLASFTGGDQIHRAADTFGEVHDGVVFVESFVAMTGFHDGYLPVFNHIANSFQYDASTARSVAGGTLNP